ncbi:uncharacterized protein LOC118734976 [Rhagoletis pomonella]|uniref:uncharacterized protein LOC118734976 n=1 Tax=Rhagoletis pomonella TaxID=28610 RepID=UPI001784CD90|nr:uncharacterized protein LOC118734976 [Rhagoletis pomonella]
MDSSLNALRASVQELRQSSEDSQRYIVRLREGMQPQSASQSSVQPAQDEQRQAVVADTDSHIKLYDLPTFGGNIEEWPLFYANFNDTTQAFGYSHRQNLMRLQKLLVGPAKEAVEALLIFANDVPNVMRELEFRFGRPDILVKGQISQLQQIPPIPESKVERIIPFSSKVLNVVAFLKSANCQQHLSNVTLLEEMIIKLPHTRQFDWAKHAATISPYPTIEHFSEWLSDLARIISLMPTTSTRISKQNAAPNNPRRLMHINRPKEILKCYHCSGSYTIAQCESFKSIGFQDRWELVKTQQLCFSCLRKGHCTQKCRSRR